MNYWRLTTKRPFGIEESFDLRKTPHIWAGDELSNHVCIDTIDIPEKSEVVSRKWRGGIQIRLTKEIIPTLSGQFAKTKEWKKRLYQGALFEAQGDCFWKIGDVEFNLTRTATVPLSVLEPEKREEEKRHLRQAAVYAIAAHLILFLFISGANFISSKFSQTRLDLSQAERITVADVEKVFPKEKFQELAKLEEAQTALMDMSQTEPVISEDQAEQEKANLIPAKPAPVRLTKKVDTKLKAQKGQGLPTIDSMGLLAIQSTTSPKKTNLDVAALAKGSVGTGIKTGPAPKRLGLAQGDKDFGLAAGSGNGSVDQVATLDGTAVASYQAGGLSDKVRRGSMRGASIKLIRREVEIRGGLDPAVIRQIIEERLPEVRYCYETALLKKTNLQGKISASWTIMPDGTVDKLSSESGEIAQNTLHPCIREQIKNWKFPAPKGGGVVHVKYPFLFSPVGS